MRKITVEVRNYPSSRTRSYITIKAPKRLCNQDGLLFRKEKTLEEGFGVITFDEAVADSGDRVTVRLGEVGRDIIRSIGAGIPEMIKEGRIVSYCQLNVTLTLEAEPELVDEHIRQVLQETMGVRVVLRFV